MKRGILLAAFGSGSFQGESTLRRFDRQVRETFPGVSVRWAFTSMLMRERLASARKKSDSVHKALKKMAFEKFTHVAVQPVHVIPGFEYGDILADAEELRAAGTFSSLVVGAPLLTEDPQSVERAASALLGELPPDRLAGEPVLFMGHGSRHAAESRYEALAEAVRRLDPLVFMGTLSGAIGLERLLDHLLASGGRRVWLLPLLAVVGRHTLEDMAGSSEDSWRSRLEAAGIACVPVLRGMMEYQGFMDIWVDNLEKAMRVWQEKGE